VLHLGGWLVLAPLSAVALARVVTWDSRSVLVGLNALTPMLFLPSWVVAIVAGVFRRWALLLAAALLVVAHLSFALPELLAAEDVPSSALTAPAFRIFSANVYAGNRDVAGYAEEIRRSRPDVVVLQEATPDFLAGLEATGVLVDLPHRLTVARFDPFAAAVASHWALNEDDVISVDGRPILLRVTVDFAGTPIRLFGVHAVAPVGGNRGEWVEDLETIGEAVAAERRPVLLAGDFNATWGHRSFRQLLDVGLTDAAAERGKAYQMTWPRGMGLVPPLTRIDHVLTTERLTVTHITTGRGRGSDHRPLIADVALIEPRT